MERLAKCHCGSLRATTSGEPLLVNMCHCKACQRRTATLASHGARLCERTGHGRRPEAGFRAGWTIWSKGLLLFQPHLWNVGVLGA